MRKLKVIILGNELEDNHTPWIRACEEFKEQLEYRIVNLTLNIWLEEIQKYPSDILLAKPGGLTANFKQLYDERICILANILRYRIFPSPMEIFIYENKRFLSYWLKANNLPHPRTAILYSRDEALEFVQKSDFPFVAKTNIGASGSGVKILHSRKEAIKYLRETFYGKGSPQRTGPNTQKGDVLKRGARYLLHPSNIGKKLSIYQTRAMNLQKGFVIFQEFVPHDFEWRAVRIGDSFFAHKKLKTGEKSSGSLKKNYDNPPLNLLEFVKGITDKHQFYSQAIDIFESNRGYLVNEMQCFFGQSDPYQMILDGRPGRFRFKDSEWRFETGDFARNACYNLRIEHLLEESLRSEK